MTCAQRVPAKHTPGLKVPCARRGVKAVAPGRALCLQHALQADERVRLKTLRQSEKELLEHVVLTGTVPKQLRAQVVMLRRDLNRWREDGEVR